MNCYSGVTRAVLAARGIELPPPGSLRDLMLRKGLVVEREQQMAMFEGLVLTLQVLLGDKDNSKLITKILESTRSILNFEIYTQEFAAKQKAKEVNVPEVFKKLTQLGQVKPNGD